MCLSVFPFIFELLSIFPPLFSLNSDIFFLLLIAVVAFLYASVGHGGASGYLALMVLFGTSPAIMKSSALILNIFVSAIAFIQYKRQGHFRWQLLMPFVLLSIPLSFVGAKIHVESHVYRIILAICLLLATLRLVGVIGKNVGKEITTVNFLPAFIIGGVLGFISGMIGIGGGILLSPILLLFYHADIKQTAAVSAAFIFLNSISGFAGASAVQPASSGLYIWAIAAIAGGTLGSFYGSSRFNHVALRYLLSVVLLFACTKLIIS